MRPHDAKGPPESADNKKQRSVPVLPLVPTNSWYAAPFSEGTTTPFTEFHLQNKGRVLFGKLPIPTLPGELEALPSRSPTTITEFELGKDLVYGMAYLHNTALYTEHRWRGRVLHLLKVKDGTAEVPESIRKVSEFMKGQQQQRRQSTLQSEEVNPSPPSQSPSPGPASLTKHSGVAGGQMRSLLSLARAEPTIYSRPFFDMLLGIKVYVDEELVPDHYPGLNSLPQCTTTLDTHDAVTNWVCVPIILMGFLNHMTLDVIDLYRTLSLSFVEHLLHLKTPPTPSENTPRSLNVRVEVVYGCRTEAYFCTDFIARGSCRLLLRASAKHGIKGYEESLRALIKARRSSEQVIHFGAGPHRSCPFCKLPYAYRCTVCGAELCSSVVCSQRPVTGYPRGCTAHKAQVN